MKKIPILVWGHMYKAFIFWYRLLTWDHWEFQLWKATYNVSWFSGVGFCPRSKGKKAIMHCKYSSTFLTVTKCKLLLRHSVHAGYFGVFGPGWNSQMTQASHHGPSVAVRLRGTLNFARSRGGSFRWFQYVKPFICPTFNSYNNIHQYT
jgi:hypothetical protein